MHLKWLSNLCQPFQCCQCPVNHISNEDILLLQYSFYRYWGRHCISSKILSICANVSLSNQSKEIWIEYKAKLYIESPWVHQTFLNSPLDLFCLLVSFSSRIASTLGLILNGTVPLHAQNWMLPVHSKFDPWPSLITTLFPLKIAPLWFSHI